MPSDHMQGRSTEQLSTNDTLALISWGGIGVMIICALIYGVGVAVGLAFGWWAA